MRDLAHSIARTAAPIIVGGVTGLAVVVLGVEVPAEMSGELTAAVTALIVALAQNIYYIAARIIEWRWPGPLSKVLLWSARGPSYGVDLPVRVVAVVDHESVVPALEEIRRQARDLGSRGQ